MNVLPFEKRRVLKRLLALGASVRQIASEVGCSANTVLRYSRMWKFSPLCGCGRPAGHQAWCRVRLDFSPARRGWLAEHWGKRANTELSATVDRAYAEAAALGHHLGRFVFASSGTSAIAYALCATCGQSARLNSGESRRDVLDGTALRNVCLSAAERSARQAESQELKQWRSAKRTLVTIQKHLRPPSSRTPASSPARTSRA